MAGNPFLAMSEDFNPVQDNGALNPFLTGDFGISETGGDNPFSASNPFSDFGSVNYDTTTVVTTSVDFFGISEPVASNTTNFFSTSVNDAYEQKNDTTVTSAASIFCTTAHNSYGQVSDALFSAPPTENIIVSTGSFFDTTIQEQQNLPLSCTAQKPTELDLSITNTIAADHEDLSHAFSSDDEPKQKRPPLPSRPIAPETKNLIMTVTGHMDFTSSHLLDRLPPTRTPSPVSMRDLHSPSPTPDHAFGDFLGDTDIKKDTQPNNEEMNLFDVDDVVTQVSCTPQQHSSPSTEIDLLVTQPSPNSVANNSGSALSSREHSPKEENISTEHHQSKPPRPGPPARPSPPVKSAPPARPLPPQKPPPPNVVPQRPPPVVPMSLVHNQPPIPARVSPSAEFSLFDAPPAPVAPSKSTKEDILSLYSTPKKQEEPPKPIDFLTDDIPESLPIQNETESQVTNKHVPVDQPMSIDFDKPQPMDITPNSEDNPIEHHEQENFNITEEAPITINECSIPESIEVTQSNVETAFYSQPVETETNQEPIHKIQPVESETHTFNIQQNFVEELSNPPEFAVPTSTSECNPFAIENDSASTNIFADSAVSINEPPPNIFGLSNEPPKNNASFASIFGGEPQIIEPSFGAEPPSEDAFDAFSAKFESTTSKDGAFDAFGGTTVASDDAWGNSAAGFSTAGDGFGVDDNFDAFLTLNEPPPVPSGTPAPFRKGDSQESDEGNFNVFIKPREGDVPFDSSFGGTVPVLAPPPARSPATTSYTDSSPRLNPFDKGAAFAEATFGEHMQQQEIPTEGRQRTDSQETPPTPLFDEDTSQPLEDFPRIHYSGTGWEVQLRQPNKKKITGQRFWKKIYIKMVYQGDNPVVQLFNSATDKEPFQELPLQACYSVSDIAAQQYDQYGKIFTVKLQYVFYKERPGVRPGQVTKAERITNKLSQFAAYAIQGDYQGVKEFGSDLKKLGLPVEHAPQVSQLFKIGSTNYEDMKQFSMMIEEALFKLSAHRDRALHYKMEEVQITAVDEIYVEQDAEGHILKQIARVRLFFLGFLSGMPDVELGVNDMWRQGKEVVGRHDIIPVATEEWIRLEGVEFHSCIQTDEYQNTRIIKFKPPDACYLELMRFRVRPPKNRELPLQLKAVMCVTGNKVELRADALVPGFTSRSLGQVPCEDVMIRFPIPECWIYLFRVEKHFRYGSVKSAHRRTGKIKGIERFLGAVDTLQESLIEVTSGQAKYEHQHRSIVWRMPRLPKEGQGAYTTHNLVCRMALTSYDQIPEKLAEWCYVEFTMPATQVSHTTVRSVSLQNHDSDEPPEKYVRYLARHEYKVGIEHTQGEGPNAYLAATIAKPTIREEPVKEVEHTPAAPSSDSDSD